jgi:hypothetical protein
MGLYLNQISNFSSGSAGALNTLSNCNQFNNTTGLAGHMGISNAFSVSPTLTGYKYFDLTTLIHGFTPNYLEFNYISISCTIPDFILSNIADISIYSRVYFSTDSAGANVRSRLWSNITYQNNVKEKFKPIITPAYYPYLIIYCMCVFGADGTDYQALIKDYLNNHSYLAITDIIIPFSVTIDGYTI